MVAAMILILLIVCIIIPVLWALFYNRYMKKVTGDYNENILDISAIKSNSAKVDRILKLYFWRQQTYEFSGYAILIICLLFLMGCICIFIFANSIFKATSTGFTDDKTVVLVSILSLRIGIALVVFFICQVLLRLYRYCLKFAAFYIGLFDALMLYKEVGIELKDAIDLFMSKVDVGKEPPKSPSQELFVMLSATAEKKAKADKGVV